MARAHEPDISTRKPPPGQVGPSDFVIHGYGFNETHLLISGPSGSKRENGMFSKLRVFFQEALAQNRWISNLRNLFFFSYKCTFMPTLPGPNFSSIPWGFGESPER